MMKKQFLEWSVGFCDGKSERPDEYFPATVPGAVQLDYARRYDLPDYNAEENYKLFRWMEDKFWVYKTHIEPKKPANGGRVFLIVKGIDYQYDITANGKTVYSHEGMYLPADIDLTEFSAGGIDLEIVIYPVPKSALPGVHKDTRDEANQTCKPAVSYGWDFHPRLIPLGVWNDIYLLETENARPLHARAEYELSENRDTAYVRFIAEGFDNASWELFDPSGKLIYVGSGENADFTIENVELWWCNGYGEQNLYEWKVTAGDESASGKMGFRTVRLVKSQGSWHEPLTYPMTRNTPPCTLELNGVRIFAKGTNWVAPEIFYGKLNKDRYFEQLSLVKGANINFIRCWGGAIINKDCFFDICDELGIMVWQEFPLACNRYEGTKEYIAILQNETTAVVDRLKSHACLMLWCGGNELFNNWSLMTEQDEALRFLNHLTYVKTPNVPFIPAAPLMGMAHGAYSFIYPDGSEIFQKMPACRFTAYTEMGVPGHSTLETFNMIAPTEQLMPMTDEHKYAKVLGRNWRDTKYEKYFGKTKTVEETIGCGQFLQYIGYQFIFEEARRQKPYCGMVANWCFNEPWPNAMNNSLVCYPNNIKPAYYAVKAACRKVLASARFRKLSYIAGDTLDFDLYLLNDELSQIPDGSVNVFIKIGERHKELIMQWDYKNVTPNVNVVGPTARYILPRVEGADTVEILLECGEYSSKYTLLYRLPNEPVNAPREMNAVTE